MEQYTLEYLRVCVDALLRRRHFEHREDTGYEIKLLFPRFVTHYPFVWGTTWQAKKGREHLTRCTKSK